MLLRGGQRRGLAAMFQIREEGRVQLAAPLQSGKETMRAMGRLVYPADARRA